jgi:hypothetical protein
MPAPPIMSSIFMTLSSTSLLRRRVAVLTLQFVAPLRPVYSGPAPPPPPPPPPPVILCLCSVFVLPGQPYEHRGFLDFLVPVQCVLPSLPVTLLTILTNSACGGPCGRFCHSLTLCVARLSVCASRDHPLTLLAVAHVAHYPA